MPAARRKAFISATTGTRDKREARWIEPNPHTPSPADAWVLPNRVSVWAVVRQLQLDSWETKLVADGFELPLAAVEATIGYYHRHRAEVDDRIERNRTFFGD